MTAVLLQWAGAGPVANFAKLGTMTFLAWAFLRFFEELSWVVLVACIVPFVDSYSVWRGPTKTIVTQKPEVFSALSFTFPVPGSEGGAKLGLPDLLFFAVYLAAADRWGLRVRLTWLCLVLSLGLTLVLAVAFVIWEKRAREPMLPLSFFRSRTFTAGNAAIFFVLGSLFADVFFFLGNLLLMAALMAVAVQQRGRFAAPRAWERALVRRLRS